MTRSRLDQKKFWQAFSLRGGEFPYAAVVALGVFFLAMWLVSWRVGADDDPLRCVPNRPNRDVVIKRNPGHPRELIVVNCRLVAAKTIPATTAELATASLGALFGTAAGGGLLKGALWFLTGNTSEASRAGTGWQTRRFRARRERTRHSSTARDDT